MKVMMIGDVFGDAGVRAVGAALPGLREAYAVDVCVANAENAAARGTGLSKSAAAALLAAGADVLTLGNHTWKDRDTYGILKNGELRVIRPANYPDGAPGDGSAVVDSAYGPVGVVNLLGRLYMEACDCPFAAADRELAKLRGRAAVIIVDMHAEATSEKCALARYLDGRVSMVAGTHTHVQTADERVLAGGTAFITDAGMTGPADGIIGVSGDAALRRFRTLIPERYTPAEGPAQFNAVCVEVDPDDGRARSIVRINKMMV